MASSQMMDSMPTARGRSTPAILIGTGTPTHMLTAWRETVRVERCTAPDLHGPDPFRETVRGLQAWTPIETSSWDSRLSYGPYRYADGELAGYVARWDKPDGGKEIRPLVLEDGRWRQKGIPRPRPLYNLPDLWEHPDAPVLVVEGEKTSDAVMKLLPSYVPTTSIGGAKAPHLSDWGPLRGCEVVVWPDNDSDGLRYARKVAALVLEAGASRALIVQLPEELPADWDLADPVPRGVDVERLLADAEPFEEEEPDAEGEKERARTSVIGGPAIPMGQRENRPVLRRGGGLRRCLDGRSPRDPARPLEGVSSGGSEGSIGSERGEERPGRR